jgi:hypothetical protein
MLQWLPRDAEQLAMKSGGEGDTSPRLMAMASPPCARSRAGRRSRVKSECPGSRDAEPTRANPFVLEARTAAACCLSAGCGDRDIGPRE